MSFVHETAINAAGKKRVRRVHIQNTDQIINTADFVQPKRPDLEESQFPTISCGELLEPKELESML